MKYEHFVAAGSYFIMPVLHAKYPFRSRRRNTRKRSRYTSRSNFSKQTLGTDEQ